MENSPFAIYVIGKDQEKHLEKCLDRALKITRQVLYIDLGSKDRSVTRASQSGVKTIQMQSSIEEMSRTLSEFFHLNWIIFIKPDEYINLHGLKKLGHTLKHGDAELYFLTVKRPIDYETLEPFQLIKKLDQFREIENDMCVSELQIRLIRRKHLGRFLDYFVGKNMEAISGIPNRILQDFKIESINDKIKQAPFDVEKHDLSCLKGEIIYDITPEEDLVEISDSYTGFRVLHTGYLDSFLEGAKLGFGHLKMYIPMLKFMGEQGYFKEAKCLYESWIGNRSEDETYYTNIIGGFIYAHLLDFDKAIRCYERMIESQKSSFAIANLGKLYFLKGDKQKAVEYLMQAEDTVNDVYLKRQILSVLTTPHWQPVTLSVCMIARDEEPSIKKAIESVDGIVDEVIVVDTGSSDRTREIVKESGGRVFEFEWQHDFSAARNRALQEAKGDYILFLDADEYIDPRHRLSLALLKQLLPISKDVAIRTKVEPPKKEKVLSIQAWLDRYKEYEIVEYQVRLFPMRKGIQFEGTVFESVDTSMKNFGINVTANEMLKITHSILNREYRERRKIPSAIKAFEFFQGPIKLIEGGLLFLRLGDLDMAYRWFEKAEKIHPALASKIAALYIKYDQPRKGKNLVEKALEQWPESPELNLSLSELLFKDANYDAIIATLKDRIEFIRKSLGQGDASRALYYLGIASIESGFPADGMNYLVSAHEADPANVLYKIAAIYALVRIDEWEKALRLTDQIAKEQGIDLAVQEINDFVDVGQVFLQINSHFQEENKDEEAGLCRKIIEQVIKTKVSKEEDIMRMSAVIKEAWTCN